MTRALAERLMEFIRETEADPRIRMLGLGGAAVLRKLEALAAEFDRDPPELVKAREEALK